MDLSNLAASIVSRRCALFAGAGLTANSGGALWSDLVDYLKNKFNYASPLEDEFEIIGDMSDKLGREVLYNAIAEKLKGAKVSDQLSSLGKHAWFTAFTTNYDLALEDLLNERQNLKIRTITSGLEYALTGISSEMLCVKLMGSLDIDEGSPGSMVLDTGDLTLAREERGRIFDTLASHAANLSFLFIGYSFNDKLFLESLQKIVKSIGKPKNTYYAVFLNKPDEKKEYLLRQFNVEIIVADLPEFAKELAKQVSIRNPKDYTSKRVPIGSDIIPIDSTKVGDFLTLYDPILLEDLELDISPQTFFKGQTNSLKPFGLKWHFPRKEIENILDAIISHNKCIIAVTGDLGSGRTFSILAAIHELITKHRSLAIKIPAYTINKIPDSEQLSIFMQEVARGVKHLRSELPERLIMWTEFPLEVSEIAQFVTLQLEYKDYPLVLITEDFASNDTNENEPLKLIDTTIDLNATLLDDEKDLLKKFIVEACRTHKFPEISEEEAKQIADEERVFLSVMYRSIDPAKRSIDQIIQEEYGKITELSTKKCISLAAISSSVNLPIPIAVLRKSLNKSIGKELDFTEIFDIALEKSGVFIKQSVDHRTNFYFSIYNPLIAQQLITVIGKDAVHELLENIAQSVDLKSRVEAEFTRNFLIDQGARRIGINSSRIFLEGNLESTLLGLMKRQPARPIIHHLARLYFKADHHNSHVIPLLNQALAEPKEKYFLTERKENILVTLANTTWCQYRGNQCSLSKNAPEIERIFSYLAQARLGDQPNIHAYHLHARILKDLSLDKDDEEKSDLLNDAISILLRGMDQCNENEPSYQLLQDLKTEIIADIDPEQAEKLADELLNQKNNGSWYFILAVISHGQHPERNDAINFLDKALSAENFPPAAIILKAEILFSKKAPDYELLFKILEQLSTENYEDNWKSAYYKGIIYTIREDFYKALKNFKNANKLAPRYLQREVQIFWEDTERRKVHTGKISGSPTEREGRIYGHGVSGWKDNIYFDPRRQENRIELKPGLPVMFEMGFSPRGPIAFDVRPFKPKVS